MTWTKLSDDFSDDCFGLSNAAFRLHVEGLIWSNRKLLDLRLAKVDVGRWATHPEAAAELVACGWWRDAGDAWVIVHHGAYQRSRAAVVAQQASNARNGKKGGRPKGPPREVTPRRRPTQTDSVSEPLTESVSAERDSQVPQSDSLTESLSESKSETPTKRDRTGQARTSGVPDLVTTNGHAWPEWRGAGPDPFQEYA